MHPILKRYETFRILRYPFIAALALLLAVISTNITVWMAIAVLTFGIHLFLPIVTTTLADPCIGSNNPDVRMKLITRFHFLPIGAWITYCLLVMLVHGMELNLWADINIRGFFIVSSIITGVFAAMTIFYLVVYLEPAYREAKRNAR